MPPRAPRRPQVRPAARSSARKCLAVVRRSSRPRPGSYTYTLSCTGTGGTQSASASVTVTPNLLAALAPTGAIPTVGSTVDPINGDQNPYGLVVAPETSGLISKGDLVVCNFNDGPTNTQGKGTTIVGLHPGTGSKPYRIAQSADLRGCNALTMLPDDSISAAAWGSNLNPLVSATGTVGTPFSDTFAGTVGRGVCRRHGHSARCNVRIERARRRHECWRHHRSHQPGRRCADLLY